MPLPDSQPGGADPQPTQVLVLQRETASVPAREWLFATNDPPRQPKPARGCGVSLSDRYRPKSPRLTVAYPFGPLRVPTLRWDLAGLFGTQ